MRLPACLYAKRFGPCLSPKSADGSWTQCVWRRTCLLLRQLQRRRNQQLPSRIRYVSFIARVCEAIVTISLRRQAAAAARIAGKGDIFDAVSRGDLALVQDHLTADPSCVHAKNSFR